MNRSVSTGVIGAVDMCLRDINGKVAGQPVHRLLGLTKDREQGAWSERQVISIAREPEG